MTQTSVVILSYRPGSWLADSVASVAHQADEVIVVDNGSSGAEASRIARAAGARPIRSEKNRGFTGGVNLGVAAAKGEVVALLNDDAVAGAGWPASAVGRLADPSVAAVAPTVLMAGQYREICLDDDELVVTGDPRPLGRMIRSLSVDGTEVLGAVLGAGMHPPESSGGSRWRWTAGRRPFYVPAAPGVEVRVDGAVISGGRSCSIVNSVGVYLRADGYCGDIGLGAPDDGRFGLRRDRFALSGTAMAFRAETWRSLGGLAPAYFAYYEDIDWCWRAGLAGLRLLFDPSSSVRHLGGATSGGATDPAVRVMAERNRTLSMVRNGPWAEVAEALRMRWQEGPDGGVRSGIARRLPWALATRAAMRSGRRRSAGAVWDRWAGTDVSWPTGPIESEPIQSVPFEP